MFRFGASAFSWVNSGKITYWHRVLLNFGTPTQPNNGGTSGSDTEHVRPLNENNRKEFGTIHLVPVKLNT